MSKVYQYAIVQEVLNEQATHIVGDIFGYRLKNNIAAEDRSHLLNVLLDKLLDLKSFIISKESRNHKVLAEIRGWLKYTEQYVKEFTQPTQAA